MADATRQTDRQTEPTILDPVNIYKRGLGIDSVLGLFRRGTKGRIPTWSASWRPFCRVADFLSLTHSLFSLPVRVKLKLGTSPAASPSWLPEAATSSTPPILSLLSCLLSRPQPQLMAYEQAQIGPGPSLPLLIVI